MKYLLITLYMLLAFACTNDCDQPIDSYCYSFDIRQCQTDLFADAVPEADSKSNREIKMMAWLENQNFFVENIRLDIDFHVGVCEACTVCPQGDRYFIQVLGTADFTNLDILNLETEECCDIF